MSEKGTLIVFSGPSGAGKDTVLEEFFKRKPQGVWKSISNTTRAPRDGETDGVDYNFITVDDFFNVVDNNGMVEYTKYGLNYYGTPKAPVDEHLAAVVRSFEVQIYLFGFQTFSFEMLSVPSYAARKRSSGRT